MNGNLANAQRQQQHPEGAMSEIDSARNRADSALHQLGNEIDKLNDRLAPVLMEDRPPPASNPNVTLAAPLVESPLGMSFFNLEHDALELRGRVETLLRRLAI